MLCFACVRGPLTTYLSRPLSSIQMFTYFCVIMLKIRLIILICYKVSVSHNRFLQFVPLTRAFALR